MTKPLLALLLLCSSSQAVDTDKVEHFGVSLGATTGLYLVCHEALRMPKPAAMVFSAGAALMIGLAAEYADAVDHGGALDTGDLKANFLGVLTSSILVWTINF